MKPSPSRSTLLSHFRENRENRQMLFWTAGLQILAWLIYKWCIPGTDHFQDSYSYVYAAIHGYTIFYRPMGYARFLALLHELSGSSDLVVTCQYFLMSWAALAFFFSVDYLLTFRNRWIKWLSCALTCLQPLLLVLANLLAGDGLFAALTILWITTLLWVLLRPGWWALMLQALALYLAFQVRYNALYYPLISCLVFLMAVRVSLLYRAAGILFTLLLTGSGYHSIRASTEDQTGADVFSGFSGWQMANNALYLSPFIDLKEESFEDPDLRELHGYVREFVDSIDPISRREAQEGKIGSAYLWDNHSPLKQYLFNYSRVNRQPYLQSWYQVATLYGDYGKALILDHPMAFYRHFLWPNACSYVMPDGECLTKYHNSTIPVPKETAEWFGWDGENPEPAPRWAGVQQGIIGCYPPMHALLFLSCLVLPFGWLVSRKWGRDRHDRDGRAQSREEGMRLLWFWYLLFLLNIVFSIVASPIVLRYEGYWFVLGGCIPLWFLDRKIVY